MITFKKLIDFKFKILIVLTLFCTSTLSISAQEWKWAESFGDSSGSSNINGMAKMSNNKIAAIGFFQSESIKVGNNNLIGIKTSPIVGVVDQNGVFENAVTFGGAGDDQPIAIATDQNDNIYVAGNFSSLVFVAGNDSLYNKGDSDGFVVKLDKNLNIIWAMSIATQFNDILNDIKVDQVGNVYFTGLTSKYIDDYSKSVFLIKILPDKTIERTNQANTSGLFEFAEAKSIYIDNDNNCYWIGNGSDLKFQNGFSTGLSMESIGFMIKYSPNGTVLSNKIIADVECSSFDQHFFYFTQFYNDTNDFYNSGVQTSKYDTSLNVIWQKRIPKITIGGGNTPIDHVLKLTTDTEGNVYLFGTLFTDTLVFAQDTILNETMLFTNYGNIFLFKYDKNGEEIWVKKLGKNFENTGNAILAYENDNLIISGSYQSDEIEFGDYTLFNNSPIYSVSIYHWLSYYYKQDYAYIASLGNIVTGIHQKNTFLSQLYPNPVHDEFTLVLPETNFKKGRVDIYNINGSLLKSQVIHFGENHLQVNTKDLPIGTHIVHIQLDDQYSIQKIVKQ